MRPVRRGKRELLADEIARIRPVGSSAQCWLRSVQCSQEFAFVAVGKAGAGRPCILTSDFRPGASQAREHCVLTGDFRGPRVFPRGHHTRVERIESKRVIVLANLFLGGTSSAAGDENMPFHDGFKIPDRASHVTRLPGNVDRCDLALGGDGMADPGRPSKDEKFHGRNHGSHRVSNFVISLNADQWSIFPKVKSKA